MCRWCRKLEPILARDSYPFPLRPLTPKLHALHRAASHRLGIFYRSRLILMNDLLPLFEPLEKCHLDLGLVEEVRDEILYLQRSLDKHPVERDEERGWDAIRGKGNKGEVKQKEVAKAEKKDGGERDKASEVGSESSRGAVVSGRGRNHDHEEDEEGSADSDGEEEAGLHPPDYASTHASKPRSAIAPNLKTHTRPHTTKPAPINQSQNQPRSKIHNPRHAYIDYLAAAKVVNDLERQERAAPMPLSRDWAESVHTAPTNKEDCKQASHLPPQARTSALRAGERHAAAGGTDAGLSRSRGRKAVTWAEEVETTALEPPAPAPSHRHKTKAERPHERYGTGPRSGDGGGAGRRGKGREEEVGWENEEGSDEEDEDDGFVWASVGAHGHVLRKRAANRDRTVPGIYVGTGVWI